MLATLRGPLAVFVLTTAVAADWSTAQFVTVIETDYRFAPSELRFRAKTPYRLHLENRGTDMHEFTAPAFFKAVEIRNPGALNQEQSEVVLQPGEKTDVYFIPRQRGAYPFSCADHDWAGMTGTIVVE